MSNRTNVTDSDHLKLVLATGNVGIWELDAQTGVAWRNQRHDEIFGYPQLVEDWTYQRFLDHVLPTDRAQVDEGYGEAVKQGLPWAFECRIQRADGQERWISAYGRPLFSQSGEVTQLIGHVIDITDTKQTEERLRLVTAELNHRVRNMLAVIDGVVRISARDAIDTEAFAEAIGSRVAALGRGHDLLAESSGEMVPLRSIVRNELAAFTGPGSRVRLAFDACYGVHRDMAERLSLVIHELMTNAIQHGALSNATGLVTLSAEPLRPGCTRLAWRESGGPAVRDTGIIGFGTTLFSDALGKHGKITMDLRPEGLHCLMDMASVSQMAAPAAVPQGRPVKPPAPVQGQDLKDKVILVLEDEPLIAISYRSQLQRDGAEVIGPFASCTPALQAIDDADCVIDAAILDVNLGDETSDAVADRLMELGIPFIFTTGYGLELGLNNRYPDALVLCKPASWKEIAQGLVHAIVSKSGEMTTS